MIKIIMIYYHNADYKDVMDGKNERQENKFPAFLRRY